MKIRPVVLALALVVLIISALSITGKVVGTEGCDYYLQHEPSPEHPQGWGECMFNPTPEPTEATNVPDPTNVPSPTPTEQTPIAPATIPVVRTPIASPQFNLPTVNAPQTPAFACGTELTTNTITVWSVEGEDFVWQVKINDTWYDLVQCYCGSRLHTGIEYRWKYNDVTGKDEYTAFTRLTLTVIMPLDVEAYRVYNNVTGEQTGQFTDLNNFNY